MAPNAANAANSAPLPLSPSQAFLGSLPAWAAGLVRAVRAKQANTFLVHGVPADLVPVDAAAGQRFLSLEEFFHQVLFAGWPALLTYNRAEGIGFAAPAMRAHFEERLKLYDAVHGTSWAQGLPRDPLNSFALLDSYFRFCAGLSPARPVAVLLPYAETVAPAAEASYRTPEDRAVSVYLRKWSQDPVLLAKNMVVVLVTESLADLDPKLVRTHSTREIEIQRPDAGERRAFLATVRPPDWYGARSDLPASGLAELTAGMTRVQLGQLLDGADADCERLTRERVREVKKEVIETEGLGLLEYVEPKYDLSMVAGMPAVKERLRRAARAIARGRSSAVPMGYLVCGPVGSAKTFLVECFANEIGFPCVKLKNFRSMWVGATESNLERILKILSSLTPVGVVVDEADAALGNREAQGDSGTQNRVFAQIAAFMGDTRNRGRILWFLITARPDLLPIDLKRQGRAEEHIPLFYPETLAEYDEIYRVMVKKLGMRTPVAQLSTIADEGQLLGMSGSDLEAVLVRAMLEAEAAAVASCTTASGAATAPAPVSGTAASGGAAPAGDSTGPDARAAAPATAATASRAATAAAPDPVAATPGAGDDGPAEVTAEHLKQALADFIPPANSREREMQVLCAVLESTSRELLPEAYRTLERGEVQARIHEIKTELRLA